MATSLLKLMVYISDELSFVHRRQFASCPAAVFKLFEALDNDSIDPSSILSQAAVTMANNGPKQTKLMDLLKQMESRDDVQKVVIFTHWIPTFSYLCSILTLKFNLFPVNPNMDDKSIPSLSMGSGNAMILQFYSLLTK